MHVALIQVPYMMGDERQGKGPGRLMQAGAEKLIAASGVPVCGTRYARFAVARQSPMHS
jgi:hypothetical protein